MKLITYVGINGDERLGLYYNGKIADLYQKARTLGIDIPQTIGEFLSGGQKNLEKAMKVDNVFKSGDITNVTEMNGLNILPPLPIPSSLRMAYFSGNDNADPSFGFANHHAILGSGNIMLEEKHFDKLSFNLRLAFIINKGGRNIDKTEAMSHIAGYMLLTEFISHGIRDKNMTDARYPGKCNDFALICSPWLVIDNKGDDDNISGKLKLQKNGEVFTELSIDTDYSEISGYIEAASFGTKLVPGDIIATCPLSIDNKYFNNSDELLIESEVFGTTYCRLTC